MIFGFTRQDNEEFAPQNEFKLDTWIDLPGPMDFNKAVMYLIIAGILTCGTMIWIAGRMQAAAEPRADRRRGAVLADARQHHRTATWTTRMAKKWFPFIGTLFLFIWFSNLIGYIPLPTNTEHHVRAPRLRDPDASRSTRRPRTSRSRSSLALIVFVSYNVEGIRAKGAGGYLKSLIPAGVTGAMAAFIFVLEFLSNFMRLISLSVRLFANILAGHLIILFMSGGLAVLLGLEALGVVTLPIGVALFLFEVGLVATLQAFIFATLTAIYLGGAVAEHH